MNGLEQDPANMPRTDFTAEVWRVHDSDGVEHGIYEDEQTAKEVANQIFAGGQDEDVQVFITKTTYQSVAFHKQRKP